MTGLVSTFLAWLVIGVTSFAVIHLLAVRFTSPITTSPSLFIGGGALVCGGLSVWPGGGCAIIPIVFFAALAVANAVFAR